MLLFYHKIREIWYTGRKKWKEFNKMIWIILGIIVVLVLIVVGVYNGLVKSRMQTVKHGVKLMCNWNVGMIDSKLDRNR